MHSIKLNIQDSVFDKVIYFLQNLPKNEVEIVSDVKNLNLSKKEKFTSIKLKTKNFTFNREEAHGR
jgi:hypothetical protein